MADEEKTRDELLALFASGQPIGEIDSQDMRDYIVSTDINSLSTGLIDGGIVTINGGDNTKVDISDGTGVFVDNHTDPLVAPVHKRVSWTAIPPQDMLDIGSSPATFLGLDLSSGTAVVVKRNQLFTAAERRDFVSLAAAVHFGNTVVESIGPLYHFALDERQTLGDLAEAIGPMNLGGGNVYSANGNNLQIDKTAGATVFIGGNYSVSKKAPNNTTDPVQTPVPTIVYTYQDSPSGFINAAPATVIDPNQWDDGSGTLQLISDTPSTKFGVQRVWNFPILNFTVIHYAQNLYGTLAAAQAAINTELFNKNPTLISGFRSWIITEQGVTDLVGAVAGGTALFTKAGRFGDVFRE